MTDALADIELHHDVPEDLFSSWSPSLSPDAERVAFISDRDGQPRVWLLDLHGGPPSAVPFGDRRVTAVSWSPTGEWLACAVARTGRSGHEAWVVRPDGTGARLVGGQAPSTAQIAGGRSQGWTVDGSLIVTETALTSQVLRLRPESGQREVLHRGGALAAMDVTADGSMLLVRAGPRGGRRLVVVADGTEQAVLPPSTMGSSESGCISPDGSVVYACTDTSSERAQLVAGELAIGRPNGELEEIALSGDGCVAALMWNVDGGLSALTMLDVPSMRQTDPVPLPRLVAHGCRLSHDGRRLVLTAEGPGDPKGVWTGPPGASLVPLSSPGLGTLRASRGASTSGIEPRAVVPPEQHRLSALDGTQLSGWLYRSTQTAPAPTMLWFHGGPEAQERPVYNSLFQSLVANGVSVFAPNVRGSTGFGRTYRSADDLGRRLRAFDDVAACAAYLADAGIAPADRIGISGRSYGGYLTLVALTRFPNLFRVGVAVSGMSDLRTWYATTEPWIAETAVTKYGDPQRDEILLTELSPLPTIDRLRAPLLLVHGADDTNVPARESEQVHARLRGSGIAHELLIFEGEGHELLATPNRVTFVQGALRWIEQYL